MNPTERIAPIRIVAGTQAPTIPPGLRGPASDVGNRERIGPYVLRRRLGQGGMGTVHLGFDEGLQRPAAIKVVSPNLASSETAIQRLRAEAQAAARLTHPNIVSVYAFGQEGGVTYIALEYIDGRDVAMELAANGPLPVDRALDIVRQTADALRYAWQNHVIHRDIKPSNLMLLADGTVKVADFGLAKRLDVDMGLTMENSVVGSPSYMAPEQGMGEQVDFRADIYSLGCTLFACLTGGAPFQAETPLAVMVKHAQEPIPEPEEVRGILGGRVVKLLKRMLAKKREDRFGSYDELIEELDKLIRLARGGRLPVEPGTLAKFGAAALVLVCAGIGVTFAIHQLGGRSSSAPAATIQPITDAGANDRPEDTMVDRQQPVPLPTAVPPPDQTMRGFAPAIAQTASFLLATREFSNLVSTSRWDEAIEQLERAQEKSTMTPEERQQVADTLAMTKALQVVEKRAREIAAARVPVMVKLGEDRTFTILHVDETGITYQRDNNPKASATWTEVPTPVKARMVEAVAESNPPQRNDAKFQVLVYQMLMGSRKADEEFPGFEESLTDPAEREPFLRQWETWRKIANMSRPGPPGGFRPLRERAEDGNDDPNRQGRPSGGERPQRPLQRLRQQRQN